MTAFSWLPKRLRFLLIIFCCFALCVACSSTPTETTTNSTSTAKILKVATEPAFPPFESKSPTGDGLVGFDIDLFNEIGKAAKFEVKFEIYAAVGFIYLVMTILSSQGFSWLEGWMNPTHKNAAVR